MRQSEKIPWSEISSFLNGTSLDEEKVIIREWLKESPENSSLLREIGDVWNITGNIPEQFSTDTNKWWNVFISRTQLHSKRLQAKTVTSRLILSSGIAALLIIAFLLGRWINNGSSNFNSSAVACTQIIAPKGHRTQVVLPDQTIIWLNAGTKVSYPSNFSVINRLLKVDGECYFEVTHDSKHPFIVRSSHVNVKVYGTHFNLKNELSGETNIALFKGKVEVEDKKNHTLGFLKPGDQMIVSPDNQKVSVSHIRDSDALIAWTKGMLVFKGQSFSSVLASLESWYGIRFHLQNSLLNDHRYTFKVKTESLREVLNLISVLTPIQYHIEGDKVDLIPLKK